MTLTHLMFYLNQPNTCKLVLKNIYNTLVNCMNECLFLKKNTHFFQNKYIDYVSYNLKRL